MTNTPRTDAEAFHPSEKHQQLVHADFARQLERELAETKRLLAEAREEGRQAGLREAAKMVEMTDLSKVADPSWKLFFADMFIQIAANIRAVEGKK
jgi:hypothetical protein